MDETNKKRRKEENRFQYQLNLLSKAKDLRAAISLYDDAVSRNAPFNHNHFNTLLHLCSISLTHPSLKHSALDYGFRIFDHMLSLGLNLKEATVTAVAKLAAAKGDADYAFQLVKNVRKYNALPKLRTFHPELFCFCERLNAEDEAYQVEEYMNFSGVKPQEAELASLLKVSAQYEFLHKLRSEVRCVSESTAVIIEEWFRSRNGCEVVGEVMMRRVKEAILRNGGGWHGLGWLGKGDWIVQKTSVDDGHSGNCKQKLICEDIDDEEIEKIAQSIATLFSEFHGWIEEHKGYEAIVDGANVGLYQQNFADGGFSISQLDNVVKELHNQSGGKWPLVILDNNRVSWLTGNPYCKKLVEEWMNDGVLYITADGPNDDWYWLYAALKLRCLVVTNDEMRDDIFELIGISFFNQWKERHQVHYTFDKGNLKLEMPPSYSLVIQESEDGSWHVPSALGSSDESSRTWLCITRPNAHDAVATISDGARSLDPQVHENKTLRPLPLP